MAIKTFTTGEVLTAADTNTYLANSGLVFVKSQTVGSGVSSVTVTDAFSTTYDNYKVQYIGGTGTASSVLSFNYTGTNGNAGFYGNLFYANFASGTANTAGYSNLSAITHSGGNANGRWNMTLELQGPFLSAISFLSAPYCDSSNAGSMSGFHNYANSYTGFVLTPTVGTLTAGTIIVYGYRKA